MRRNCVVCTVLPVCLVPVNHSVSKETENEKIREIMTSAEDMISLLLPGEHLFQRNILVVVGAFRTAVQQVFPLVSAVRAHMEGLAHGGEFDICHIL